MRIKLLFITDGLSGGGKERQLAEIIRNIDRKCYEIGVITFNKNQHYTDFVRNNTEFLREIDKTNKFKPLKEVKYCLKYFKPDIVHTWDSMSSFYTYFHCKRYKIKFIDGSIRDAGIEKGWQYHFKRFFLSRADAVISNSTAGLKKYKVTGEVLYNAIDINRFKEPEITDDFNIIMTANFTDYKDHMTFVNAVTKLIKSNVVNIAYLAGEGKNRSKIMELIERNHHEIACRFIFPGAVKNIEDYLSKCKIGVLCSTEEYGEGISNSILEYMAAGLIPIATNVGGTSEIIEDSMNGYLIKPKNSAELEEKIKYIKNNYNSLTKLKENSRKTIQHKFNYENNINKLLSIYDNILRI